MFVMARGRTMAFTRRLLAFSLLILGCPTPLALAAEQTLLLDPTATRVSFRLDATFHSVEGTLALKRGEIRFDLAAGTASGEIVIDATSADTSNKGRDGKLHHEVLSSATYPEIVFSPTAIAGSVDDRGTGTVTLAGIVSIHGGQHEVKLTATVARDGDRVRGEGKLTVPYIAWGMRDPSVFVLRVAKVVEVTFVAVGRLGHASPATPTEPGR